MLHPRRSALLAAALLALALGACGVSCGADGAKGRKAEARAGVLDLRALDLGREDVSLEGEWEFLPGAFVPPGGQFPAGRGFRRVPDLWEKGAGGGPAGFGAASYRLVVLLPEGAAGLGLSISTISTAFEAYANGILVAAAGKPALGHAEARPAYLPQVARLPEAEGGRLELLVYISNYEYRSGGFWRPFVLGSEARLSAAKRWRDSLAVGLASGLGAMVVHALVLFGYRRSERSYLYFALFAFVVALRSLVTGEYMVVETFSGISFELLIRLEYVTAFLTVPSAILFFTSLFPYESSPALRFLLVFPHLPFALLIPWAPLPFLTRSILLYYPFAWLSVLASLLLVLGRAAIRKRRGGIPLFVACIVVLLAGLNDMLFSSFVLNTANLLPFALAAFVVVQDVVLSRRFTFAYHRVEDLSAELGRANELLGREIEVRRETSARLERLIAEKDGLLKEMHHRVKNSLQIVSSIMTLQSHRLTEPEAIAACDGMRDRIRSVSLVHEKLYSSSSTEAVNLGDYVRDLAGQLTRSYGAQELGAAILVSVEKCEAELELAVDIGLVLTELVSNAFRHAVLPRRGGTVSVSLVNDGRVAVLRVQDEGPGFPPGLDLERLPTLGFRVARSILGRRGGELRLSSGEGAVAEAFFPLRGPASAEGRAGPKPPAPASKQDGCSAPEGE